MTHLSRLNFNVSCLRNLCFGLIANFVGVLREAFLVTSQKLNLGVLMNL